MEKDCKELNKLVGSANSKIGHLNESAIRTNLDSKEAGKPRNISTFYQLIKCYGKASDEKWTDENTHESCKRVVNHLKASNSEKNFCLWYHKKAVNWLKDQSKVEPMEKLENINPSITKNINPNENIVQCKIVMKYKDQEKHGSFSGFPIENLGEFSQLSIQDLWKNFKKIIQDKELSENKEADSENVNVKIKQNITEYEVSSIYKANQFTNYIPGPIEKWDEFIKPNSPIFLLALFESLKDNENLLSFPPPGILTMDVPVKISSGKSLLPETYKPEVVDDKYSEEISTVLIEVGEIKTSEKGIEQAKLQLRRSLLFFKWLDQVISPVDSSYGLIGNIYIEGNSSRPEIKTKTEFPGKGITFKIRYAEYK